MFVILSKIRDRRHWSDGIITTVICCGNDEQKVNDYCNELNRNSIDILAARAHEYYDAELEEAMDDSNFYRCTWAPHDWEMGGKCFDDWEDVIEYRRWLKEDAVDDYVRRYHGHTQPKYEVVKCEELV